MSKKTVKDEPPKVRRNITQPAQMTQTAVLVEGAMMVALGVALSLIPFFHMPWGGSVTCFSTLPLIVMSLRHGLKWGVFTGAVFGAAHALMGMSSVAAAGSFGAMILCVLLDYFFAYASVGLSGPIAKSLTHTEAPQGFMHPKAALAAGIIITGLMRLFCSFLSGVLIWGAWAPEGVPVWQYSLAYNAGWCLPDVAITLFAAVALSCMPGAHILNLPESKK